jgi:hypothetical protein
MWRPRGAAAPSTVITDSRPMTSPAFPQHQLRRLPWIERLIAGLAAISLYLIAASTFTHLYFDEAAHHVGKQTQRMVDHELRRPFAYRLLTTEVVRAIHQSLPEKLHHRLRYGNTSGEERPLKAARRYDWKGHDQTVFAISYLLVWLLSVAVLLLWAGLLRQHGGFSPAARLLAPPLALMFLPTIFSKAGYIYDIPELFLFSAGLLLVLRQRFMAYYLVFALACLNKETGLLMGAYFAPLLRARHYRRFATHTLLHVVIGVPLLLAIRALLQHMPGDEVEFHLRTNLAFLLSPEPWFKFDDIYALQLPTPRAYNIINLILVLGPLVLFRRQLDAQLRTMALAMLTILVPLYLLFGYKDEVRVFVPLLPCVFVLYTRAILQLFERRRLVMQGMPPQAGTGR